MTNETARAWMEAYLNGLAQQQVAAWSELWTEDGVLEYPFEDRREVGRVAIANSYERALAAFGPFRFWDLEVMVSSDQGAIVAEFKGEATLLGTNKLYRQRYVLMVFLAEGRARLIREYRDPNAYARAAD